MIFLIVSNFKSFHSPRFCPNPKPIRHLSSKNVRRNLLAKKGEREGEASIALIVAIMFRCMLILLLRYFRSFSLKEMATSLILPRSQAFITAEQIKKATRIG
jgi:hypothetical protein